jgi:WD40 repeat protein
VKAYASGFVLALLVFAAESATDSEAAPPITAIAFVPGGNEIAAVSQAGVVVYAWPSLKQKRVVDIGFSHANDLAFSADGKTLAIAGGEPSEAGGFQLLSWPAGVAKKPVRLFPDAAYQLAWLAGDAQLVLAGADGQLLLATTAGGIVRRFTGHSRDVNCVAVGHDGKHVLSGSNDQSIRVWELETGELVHTLGNHTGEVFDLALRPEDDGLPWVASAGGDKIVRFWQPTIGRMVRFVRLSSTPLAIDWTPDGRYVLAACDDGRLRVIDAEAAKVVQDAIGIRGWAYAVAATTHDGALVAGEDGTMGFIPLRYD